MAAAVQQPYPAGIKPNNMQQQQPHQNGNGPPTQVTKPVGGGNPQQQPSNAGAPPTAQQLSQQERYKQHYRSLLKALQQGSVGDQQIAIAQLEHLCGMNHQHTQSLIKEQMLQIILPLLHQPDNDPDLLKHGCELLANVAHSCIENKDVRHHEYVSAGCFSTVLFISQSPDPSVAASACRAMWNMLWRNIKIYETKDYKDRIKKAIPAILKLLSANSLRAKQNASGVLWVMLEHARPLFVAEVGSQLQAILNVLGESVASTSMETQYCLLSLLNAMYTDMHITQTSKWLPNPQHQLALKDIDRRLKIRFGQFNGIHMMCTILKNDLHAPRIPVINRVCDILSSVLYNMQNEQSIFINAGGLQLLAAYCTPDKAAVMSSSYSKLSLALLSACYQYPQLKDHIPTIRDMCSTLTQFMSNQPPTVSLAISLAMCCLAQNSTDIQQLFIHHGGLTSLLKLLNPPRDVYNPNDAAKLKKLSLCLITHISIDNPSMQREIYQLDGVQAILDCIQLPAVQTNAVQQQVSATSSSLTIYAVKALAAVCKNNEPICQYLLSITFPLNEKPAEAGSYAPPKRSLLSTLISLMANNPQASINESLTLSSAIASLCGSHSKMFEQVASQLLSHTESTNAVNRVCNYLKEQQKLAQQRAAQLQQQQQRITPSQMQPPQQVTSQSTHPSQPQQQTGAQQQPMQQQGTVNQQRQISPNRQAMPPVQQPQPPPQPQSQYNQQPARPPTSLPLPNQAQYRPPPQQQQQPQQYG